MQRKKGGILKVLVGKARGSRNTQTQKGKQGGLKGRSQTRYRRWKTIDRLENSRWKSERGNKVRHAERGKLETYK